MADTLIYGLSTEHPASRQHESAITSETRRAI